MAILFASLSVMLPSVALRIFDQTLHHVSDRPVAQLLDTLHAIATAAIPGDAVLEQRAGVEAHHHAAELARPLLGGREQRPAEARALRSGAHRHAPQEKIVLARRQDQHT